jgi:hypothetical protein
VFEVSLCLRFGHVRDLIKVWVGVGALGRLSRWKSYRGGLLYM